MICKKNIVALYLFAVLCSSVLLMSGYPFFHRLLLAALEMVAFYGVFLFIPNVKFRGVASLVFILFSFFLFNIILNSLIGKWTSDQVMVALTDSLWWLLVFLFTYAFAQLGIIEESMIRDKMLVIVIVIGSFFSLFKMFNVDGAEFVTSNSVYTPLLLLPYVFLLKGSKLRIFCFCLILICVLLSLKRTAVVAFAGTILGIYLLNIRYNTKKDFVLNIVYMSSLFVFFYIFNNYLDGKILYRFSSAAEDGGSGRTEIYSAVIRHFVDLNFEEQIFGRGHNMVRCDQIVEANNFFQHTYLSAHNDFIEVLYDYGFVGEILYLLLLFKLCQSCFFWRNRNRAYFYAMASSIIITICVSLFSHLVIYPTYFANLMLLWAVMENEKNKLEHVYD